MKDRAGMWGRCAALLGCLLSLDGMAEGTFSSLIENDTIAGTDRHYTNGLEFSYLSEQDAVPLVLRPGLAVMPGFGERDVLRYGITFGQQIFTPENTDATEPLPNERPYAAWLYLGLGVIAEHGSQLDTWVLNLGVVGPSAHGEQVQNRLKRLAEQRMKRLNEIYSLLTDPKRRKRYDAWRGEAPWRSGGGRASLLNGRVVAWLWVLAICVAAIWWSRNGAYPPVGAGSGDPAASVEAAEKRETPGPKVPAPVRRDDRLLQENQALREALRVAVEERDRAFAQGKPARIVQPEASPPPAASPAPLAAAAPLASPAPVDRVEKPRGMAGTWVYVPLPGAAARQNYAAEYIELLIVNWGGNLSGRYRGRYRVIDRALSPEVNFRFEGAGNRFEWRGNGGARGEIRLTLQNENSLLVEWFTSEPGAQPALSSGSATLVRRLDASFE